MKQFRHGKSDHPHFFRWNGFVQRCYSPTNFDYPNYGGRGIRVADIWAPSNPEGVENFIEWFDTALIKFIATFPHHAEKRLELGRKDTNKDYSPDNCEVRLFSTAPHLRRNCKLTHVEAIEIRRLRRENPNFPIAEIAELYGVKKCTISLLLRGRIWSCINDIEPPLPGRKYRKAESLEAIAA